MTQFLCFHDTEGKFKFCVCTKPKWNTKRSREGWYVFIGKHFGQLQLFKIWSFSYHGHGFSTWRLHHHIIFWFCIHFIHIKRQTQFILKFTFVLSLAGKKSLSWWEKSKWCQWKDWLWWLSITHWKVFAVAANLLSLLNTPLKLRACYCTY